MRDQWVCLMHEGDNGLVSDVVRDALMAAARTAYKKQLSLVRLRTDACEGYLTTSWTRASVGGQSGIVFEGTVDSSDGTGTTARFLMRTAVLELDDPRWEKAADGVWGPAPEGVVSELAAALGISDSTTRH